MTTPLEIWDLLRSSADAEPGWHARRLDPDSPIGILAAIHKPNDKPGLLLEVSSVAVRHSVEYPECRGFNVYPVAVVPGPNGRTRVCLELAEPNSEDLFAILAEDVATAVRDSSSQEEAFTAMLRRLDVWQKFMRKQDSGGLSRGEVIGLFGELVVAEQFLEAGATPRQIIEGWQGPLGGLRDFTVDGTEIEVKATTRQPATQITITSLSQLDEKNTGQLFLAHAELAVSDHDGRHLEQLIGDVREILARTDASLIRVLNDRLLQVGYSDGTPQTVQTRYRVLSVSFFTVEFDFPRILPNEVRQGVIDSRYDIQIGALAPYRVSEDTVIELLR